MTILGWTFCAAWLLEGRLRFAAEQLQQIAELLVSMNIVDEKPPHY